MSQAIALMPSLNNYGSTDTNAAETFITNGLSKVLKINNICGYGTDGSDLYDCGLASQIVDGGGTKQNLPKEVKSLNEGIITWNSPVSIRNTKAAAFETANGESILAFYNPNCTAKNVLVEGSSTGSSGVSYGLYTKQHVCANFVFDLNGKKGPNTVGKDIGVMSVLYSSDSQVVMPTNPKSVSGTKNYADAANACKALDNYRLPNIEEVVSVYYNRLIFADSAYGSNINVWSGTSVNASTAYSFGYISGIKFEFDKVNKTTGVFCVER